MCGLGLRLKKGKKGDFGSSYVKDGGGGDFGEWVGVFGHLGCIWKM